MYEVAFHIITLKDSFSFEIKFSPNDKKQLYILNSILRIFEVEKNEETEAESIKKTQINNKSIRQRLEQCIEINAELKLHSLYKLRTVLENMPENEFFFVIQNDIKDIYEYSNEIENLLKLNKKCTESINLLKNSIENELKQIFESYEMIPFIPSKFKNKKIKIGEGFKKNRVCRFCSMTYKETSFNKEAHAISEALGNKSIILNEECDNCNEFFDKNIERDFLTYHDITRTAYGIKNKQNQVPKIKTSNGAFEMCGDKEYNIKVQCEKFDSSKPPILISLDPNKKIKPQNLYKTLCKFALSLISSDDITHFEKTINWIKGDIVLDKLPKVIEAIDQNSVLEEPSVMIFRRKTDDVKLPYIVAEFSFASFKYIYMIPLCEKDTSLFLEEEQFAYFYNCFSYLSKIVRLDLIDLSNNNEISIIYDLKFKKRNEN